MTKISVIIPVYNAANYINECIGSVLNQSLEDFEIICVDDGSTDNSLEILQSYKQKDNRIKIITQSNKGLGAARNIAMAESEGDYILFLDSDDYITKDSLLELYEEMTSKSLDLLIFKIINFDDETYQQSISSYFEMNFLKKIVKNNVFNWKLIKNRLFDMSVTAPGKMFKRTLIQDVEFPVDIIFEDNLFFIKMIFKAERIYFLDKHYYHRRLRNKSITNSYFNQFTDCIKIYDLIGEYLKESGKYDEFSCQLFNRKCKDIYTRFSKIPEEYKQNFYQEVHENFSSMKKSLEVDGTLEKCSKRSLVIYNSALNSKTYNEFDLSVQLFDLKKSNDKLNRINENYLQEINDLKNSTSWKVTKIFRSFIRLFK